MAWYNSIFLSFATQQQQMLTRASAAAPSAASPLVPRGPRLRIDGALCARGRAQRGGGHSRLLRHVRGARDSARLYRVAGSSRGRAMGGSRNVGGWRACYPHATKANISVEYSYSQVYNAIVDADMTRCCQAGITEAAFVHLKGIRLSATFSARLSQTSSRNAGHFELQPAAGASTRMTGRRACTHR